MSVCWRGAAPQAWMPALPAKPYLASRSAEVALNSYITLGKILQNHFKYHADFVTQAQLSAFF